jgi:hypothetical protein
MLKAGKKAASSDDDDFGDLERSPGGSSASRQPKGTTERRPSERMPVIDDQPDRHLRMDMEEGNRRLRESRPDLVGHHEPLGADRTSEDRVRPLPINRGPGFGRGGR